MCKGRMENKKELEAHPEKVKIIEYSRNTPIGSVSRGIAPSSVDWQAETP